MVLTDPGACEAGVLPGGAGAAVAGDALGRNAELEQPLGSGRRISRHVDRLDAALTQHLGGHGGGGRSDLGAAADEHGQAGPGGGGWARLWLRPRRFSSSVVSRCRKYFRPVPTMLVSACTGQRRSRRLARPRRRGGVALSLVSALSLLDPELTIKADKAGAQHLQNP